LNAKSNLSHGRFAHSGFFIEDIPFSLHEKVWFRYLGRKKIKDQKAERFNPIHQILDDTFYSRDMYKQNRKMMFGVMRDNHRK